MERMKIRNPKAGKWRWWLLVTFIALVIMVAMNIYLDDHALSPAQIVKNGQYCRMNTRWMSDAFAVETLDDEDTYDYFLVLSKDEADKFFIIKSWTDDEQCLKYIDSLYESGDYKGIEQEWTGGSQLVDDDVKNYAREYVSDYLGMNVDADEYDRFFYSYCMDLTNMGDMDTVIGGMLLALVLFIIGLIGLIISAVRWRIKVSRLQNEDFFPRFERNWQRTGEKMDTGKRPMVVVPEFLLIPSYKSLVVRLDSVVWCYVLPLAKKTYGLYVMDTKGKVISLCRIKEKKGIYVREYLEQIHHAAPWMAIGYSSENREAFGAFMKNKTIEKIIAEKDKIMSQFPL